jgi:hypothetical protein
MEFSADPFNPVDVSHFCYTTCDGQEIPSELRPSSMPIYRDDTTRGDFVNVANFFGCMDTCGHEYMVKRAVFITPFVLLGTYFSSVE